MTGTGRESIFTYFASLAKRSFASSTQVFQGPLAFSHSEVKACRYLMACVVSADCSYTVPSKAILFQQLFEQPLVDREPSQRGELDDDAADGDAVLGRWRS